MVDKKDTKKYCAFGAHYKDNKGIILSESKSSYHIKYENHDAYWSKWAVKVFSSKKGRDDWFNKQNFQYDLRS